jgi:hypothetical protein
MPTHLLNESFGMRIHWATRLNIGAMLPIVATIDDREQ